MKKILIASHGEMANGVASTIKIIAGTNENIQTISAYTENIDLDEELDKFISSIKSNDEVFVFTDLYGGSVNQKITLKFTEKSIKANIIAGFNIAVILEIILSSKKLNDSDINEIIKRSRMELKKSQLINEETVNESDEFFN